jgi:SAM-dependent methyltransferase
MNELAQLREQVRSVYSRVAEAPQAEHPFSIGRRFAEQLGYPLQLLDRLPGAAVEAFTGVSNVAMFAQLPEAATVLDAGCGAGLDSLIAAQRVGARGAVIGVDFSAAMLARARHAAAEAGLSNAAFRRVEAERLPLADASVDVVLVNGIFNLNPARAAIFRELARVVRPGGAVYAAELILKEPPPPQAPSGPADWFA